MPTSPAAAPLSNSTLPWYRQVTRPQWNAFFAAYLGWMLDGFDFTILTFLLVDIQRSFTVNNALAGLLGTVTLIFRVVGGVGAGTAADRWGRKWPLMASIAWYSVLSFLSGFSTSYGVLFACRALFGIGMGGVWAAGMPLALEHWPPHLRGIASGLLQGGYAMGFMLSSAAYTFVYPLVSKNTDLGWRVMLWLGVLPAVLVVWILRHVPESPIWLERQRQLSERKQQHQSSFNLLFQRDLIWTTIHTSLFMGALLAFYQAVAFWYPTLLGQMQRSTLGFLVAFNLAAVFGNIVVGRTSETILGRRGAASLATLVGLVVIPLYVFSSETLPLMLGAMVMGFATGNFGMVPGYLSERFPTAARGAGAGFAYHVGAAIAAVTPYIIGSLQDGGMTLARAMAITMGVTAILTVGVLWLGPETRGRQLRSAN